MVTRHQSADEFLAAAEPFLMRAEAENNLILGVAQGLARSPTNVRHSYLATLSHAQEVLACAVHIAPYKLVITRAGRESLSTLARDAFAAIPNVNAVTGPAHSAADFALAWSELSGVESAAGMRFTIYEIRAVLGSAPPVAAGRFRPATDADLPVLAGWMDAFVKESSAEEKVDAGQIIADAIRRGRLFVWDDGEPVAMAAWAGKTPNGVRINLVYTPPERRRRGYGTACVRAISTHLLTHDNAFCCLYTDASSDASSTLFTRLGYRPVSEVSEYYLKGQSSVGSRQ